MADLIEFLQARLDEDEAAARAALGDDARWVLDRSGWRVMSVNVHDTFGQWVAQPDGDERVAEHVARWDPARVLAEVEAKRAVLDMLNAAVWRDAQPMLLMALAQPYADHPDFDPAWRG